MATLQQLAEKIEIQQRAQLIACKLNCEANMNQAKTSVRPGKLYTKIDIGTSGRYMVENASGKVFGIKAYGVIHHGHQYGTLETIDDWYWGGYVATPVLGD